MSDSLQPHGLQPTRLLYPWDFSDKNTGVGCHFHLQGLFLNQGSNQHLLHWQVDSLPMSHLGNLPQIYCSLCLIFIKLINMCLGVFCLGFILFGTLGLLDLGDYFLPHFKEVFKYYLLKYFLMVFLFVFFFCDPYDSNVVAFNIVMEVPEIVLISYNSLYLFPLCFVYCYHSLFYLTSPTFCLCYSTAGSLQSVSSLLRLLLPFSFQIGIAHV